MSDTAMCDSKDAKTDWGTRWSRACGISFGVGTQLLFFVTVYYLFFFLRDGITRPTGGWLAMDCALALQFAAVHSFLLLPRTRSALSRIIPSQLYGNLFAVATCAC